MSDILILNHDIGFDHIAGGQVKSDPSQRGDEFVAANLPDGEDIDVEKVARAQKLDGLFQLLVKAIVIRNSGVAGQPAVRYKRAVFCSVVRQGNGRALHVASLAGGEIRGVKGERIALREFGLLPFIESGEGANEFVIVQRGGQVSLVAGGAELRIVQKVVHDGLGVALGMAKDHIEGNLAGNAVSVLVDERRRNAHFNTGIAIGGVKTEHGVTGGAGETVGVEARAVYFRILGKCRAQYADRVVATVAKAGECDATRFVADEKINAGAIEGCAESIGVERLAPLLVSLLVAGAAILRRRKSTGLDKAFSLHLDVTRRKGVSFP